MTGNFKKHNTGWEFRYKYVDPFTKKPREKSQRGFRTKPDAVNALKEFIRTLESGLQVGDISLSEFLDEWIVEYKTGTIRKNTMRSLKNSINKHIKPYFKSINLKEIKPVMYQKFLNKLSDDGYSKRTIEIIHACMYQAMEKAVLIGRIEKNPCIKPVIKGTTKPKGIVKFIDSEYIEHFLKCAFAYGYIYWIFFLAMIESGMRKGEVAALQWTDIDLKNSVITIENTLDFQPDDEEELFGDTKNGRERKIKISNYLTNVLKDHLKYQNRNKVMLNDSYQHDLNLVFCRDDGSPMPKSTLFNAFERILKRADLPKLPIHSLRHSHAVLMLEAGADITYVSERLGHGGEEITKKVYLHVSKKMEARSMAKYEERLSSIINGES